VRTVEEHLAVILASVRAMAPRRVPLEVASGLVLASDVHAALALPPFDNSAMDGYAVRAEDVALASSSRPVVLRVVADLPAGSAEDPALPPGTCARIMTGAPLPTAADAVVPVEASDGGTQRVTILAPGRHGQHVRRAGEDVTVGDVVLTAGTALGAPQLAAAAATGNAWMHVHPRPRVAVISTGSELVPPGHGNVSRRGLIPDSNSYLLAAAVAEAGCEAVRIGAVPDDPVRLGGVLDAVLRGDAVPGGPGGGPVDAIVTSGGVSVGAYDVVKALFAPGGRPEPGDWAEPRDPGSRGGTGVQFATVAMQPGKPQGFGALDRPDGARVPVFALPGNPVSAFVSFEVFVRPALRALRGVPGGALTREIVSARASVGWRCPPGRRQYLPVVVRHTGRGWDARPAGPRGSGSHLAVTLAAANGLGIVDAGVDAVRPGDTVPVMLTGDLG
jgi:molybdopterin molybdotransferase